MEKTVCNKCGKEFGDNPAKGTQKINLNFSYESIYDSQKWEFDLCDECLAEIIKGFSIIPSGYDKYDHEEYWESSIEVFR